MSTITELSDEFLRIPKLEINSGLTIFEDTLQRICVWYLETLYDTSKKNKFKGYSKKSNNIDKISYSPTGTEFYNLSACTQSPQATSNNFFFGLWPVNFNLNILHTINLSLFCFN